MAIPYPDHFGASDQSPARLDIRVVRGDDWRKELFFSYAHRNLHTQPVSIVETPIDLDAHVFESAIFHIATQESFAEFTINDLPYKGTGWVEVWLKYTDTARVEPGTYGFRITTLNAQAGEIRTWIEGSITVLPRPEPGVIV